ncbi:helix-turn-helix domain-containing protein [Candidatus Stoquefichus massiliensis]|uniref:helix-turn-helix domain-containing protein n=1 Tax=Candidatus Stoquefichus massiliensis TaxID=1470350 RepID=UPI0004BBD377|nr:helix-turn-helix transcriptional regulator [Candidatus Stoquefichus massiliensis]
MEEKTFSKKLIQLRKKFHLTQQELADQLHVSNKTISRWETNEGYPDIDLLVDIAEFFHVSIDYLLKDHEDFKELDKFDLISYIPWMISLLGILTYYIFNKLSIPFIFSFIVYYFIIRFSYQFLTKYTDRKNGKTLVKLNTISSFFVVQSLTAQILLIFVMMSITGQIFIIGDYNVNFSDYASQFSTPIVLSYLVGAIYAFIHYKGHMTDEYCQNIKNSNKISS